MDIHAGSPAHAGIDPTRSATKGAKPQISPAYAGIDLATKATTETAAWLPRTRGDRPGDKGDHGDSGVAPSHTRGYFFGLLFVASVIQAHWSLCLAWVVDVRADITVSGSGCRLGARCAAINRIRFPSISQSAGAQQPHTQY